MPDKSAEKASKFNARPCGYMVYLEYGEERIYSWKDQHGYVFPWVEEMTVKINAAHEKAVQEKLEQAADIVHGELHGGCEDPDISVGEQSCDRCKDIHFMEKSIRALRGNG